MKTSAHIAARELFEEIHAPLGRVNTVVDLARKTPRIKVLVDAQYMRWLPTLPRTFKGYAVVVETRELAVAQA